MAIWSHVWYIVGPLFMVILGHWSLLLHGDMKPAHFVISFHSKAFGDRHRLEGDLDTWHRLCHYHNGNQVSSGHIYIFNGLWLYCLGIDGLQALQSRRCSFEACCTYLQWWISLFSHRVSVMLKFCYLFIIYCFLRFLLNVVATVCIHTCKLAQALRS